MHRNLIRPRLMAASQVVRVWIVGGTPHTKKVQWQMRNFSCSCQEHLDSSLLPLTIPLDDWLRGCGARTAPPTSNLQRLPTNASWFACPRAVPWSRSHHHHAAPQKQSTAPRSEIISGRFEQEDSINKVHSRPARSILRPAYRFPTTSAQPISIQGTT